MCLIGKYKFIVNIQSLAIENSSINDRKWVTTLIFLAVRELSFNDAIELNNGLI